MPAFSSRYSLVCLFDLSIGKGTKDIVRRAKYKGQSKRKWERLQVKRDKDKEIFDQYCFLLILNCSPNPVIVYFSTDQYANHEKYTCLTTLCLKLILQRQY